MAITNAQQFKQLVNPPMEGKKRPGYRGDAAARSTGAEQSGRADPGSRGDPGEGRATTAGVSEATGGFAPTRGVSANVGPTGRDDLVRQSLLNRAKAFRKQQQEKRKGLNLFERFRLNRLKKLFEKKNLPQSKYAPVGIELLQSLTPTQLSVYGSTSEDDLMDTGYGMTGEDLTDSDRLADAINKAESTGVISQSKFEDAFFGKNNPQDPKNKTDRDDGPKPILPIIPKTIAKMTDNDDDADEKENVGKMFRLLADGGMTEDAPVGGIMDIETGRQMYGLGKLVKKATRAVKKIVKSPIGKAALIGGLGYLGVTKTAFGQGLLADFGKLSALQKAGIIGGGLLTAAPFFMKEEDDEEDIDRGPPLEIDRIRANPYLFTPRRFAAEGGSMKEPVAKKTMPLIDMDGKEKDYRETGGFVDMGRMERADDVPARLSKNEFVFTADAVRNAGDGSVDKGAEVMYNMMKNLEAGGDVSEESQGLDGARKMFQTSQRLGEVL